MERVNKILHHPVFQRELKQIEEWESDRVFCRHGLDHALDVARICWIMVLEGQYAYPKDVVYAAALLHDIGRARQYTAKIAHEVAGIVLAEEILKDCGYNDQEIREISALIGSHRICEEGADDVLAGLFFKADKQSRNCFGCKVSDRCKWPEEQKIMEIDY